MAKVSEFTKVSIISSMTPEEASAALTSFIYVRGKFTSLTGTKYRELINGLIVAFQQAGVKVNG